MDKSDFLKAFAGISLLTILFLPQDSSMWRLCLLLGIPAGIWWFLRLQ